MAVLLVALVVAVKVPNEWWQHVRRRVARNLACAGRDTCRCAVRPTRDTVSALTCAGHRTGVRDGVLSVPPPLPPVVSFGAAAASIPVGGARIGSAALVQTIKQSFQPIASSNEFNPSHSNLCALRRVLTLVVCSPVSVHGCSGLLISTCGPFHHVLFSDNSDDRHPASTLNLWFEIDTTNRNY